ncbi:hypothetical protein cypCar_00034994 [Cyprinus carpio]|nr:hypothetical protein cypCar_00034994 [Cyprinus carpio]
MFLDSKTIICTNSLKGHNFIIFFHLFVFRALWHCEEMIQRYSREVNRGLCSSGTPLPYCSNSNVGKAVEDCMRAIIGVLLNLTHDNEWGSTKTGEQEGFMTTALNCVLRVPQYLPQERRFDIRVLVSTQLY